jgi:hypothetical protein
MVRIDGRTAKFLRVRLRMMARELTRQMTVALRLTRAMTLKLTRPLTRAQRVTILVHDNGAAPYQREGWPAERSAR